LKRQNSLQITKDELRNHDSLLLVHLDWDTLSVVHHRDLILFTVNGDFDLVHGIVVDLSRQPINSKGLRAPRHTLLSAALTRISSKILKKPGTKVVFLMSASCYLSVAYRLTIIFVASSYTHIIWVIASTDPMYESGRLRTCSSCDSCESARHLSCKADNIPSGTSHLHPSSWTHYPQARSRHHCPTLQPWTFPSASLATGQRQSLPRR